MLETTRPSALRVVSPAQPRREVAGEPCGPGLPLVVAHASQLALGLAHLDERVAHPRGRVVLDPQLELHEPRLVEARRIAGVFCGGDELL